MAVVVKDDHGTQTGSSSSPSLYFSCMHDKVLHLFSRSGRGFLHRS
jgi:hypothetical protein